jgi:isopropylmalate/homocitrate/citramalate synthase
MPKGQPVNDKLAPITPDWRISQHCFAPEIRAEMSLPPKVQLCDITLREGRQLPGVSLTLDQVMRIADKLAEAGVTMVQMHHDEPEEMRQVAKRHPQMMIDALVHPTAVLNPKLAEPEIDSNYDNGATYSSLALSFSPHQMCLFESMAGAKVTIEEAIDRACQSVNYARRKAGRDRKVGALIQDCTRMPLDELKSICRRLVDAGADMIRLDDINGMAIYRVYTHVVREMKKALPGTEIALHTHNDIGMAAAALYAGLEGGADIIDACVNGLGERANIACFAEVASVIQIYYGFDCGIRLDKMKELSELVSKETGWQMPREMPFVGQKAFSHLVEVHYAVPEGEEGFWTYFCMKPHVFGNETHNLLGHYSGPWAVRTKAKELGLAIPAGREKDVLAALRAKLKAIRRDPTNDEFRDLVKSAI